MKNQACILVVEDERKIAELICDYLKKATYKTHWLDRGDLVDEWVRKNQPDVVLLDLMLPGKDGIEVCRELRVHSNVPIIMVTAKVDEIDRLLGLELGADDYVCKPFSPREVVARVKASLRRIEMMYTKSEEAHSGLMVDEERFEASIDNRKLDLTPVEFRLLAFLASQPGRVFSRDQLMSRIYEDGRVVSDRTVDSHIKNLRQKIHGCASNDEMIQSIYGVGYKLI